MTKINTLQEWTDQTKKVYAVFNKLSCNDLRLLEHVSGIAIDINESKDFQILKLMIRFGIPYPSNVIDFSK